MVNYEFMGNLTQWRKDRLDNYGKKKGLKRVEVLDFIQKFATTKDAVQELDSVCDPEYHSSNQPIKS